ncbi:SusC/RagA family TonB-linked outer membrane protein [Hufsiella ginkgonis]|uniref:SusC/RagA family TonB-linked outer membrane protein n=1 Tax=Hufsiella ginkgonis TaxID=2695274 RepID=A0A7K1XS39_9SPHI|nr:SusC/RagA family TonB-linked outer membrane protein [Hufsiella ginkgonis]MXV13803.1 SusC/RagA family TonB-linked outer membrane protein [Hufsiella ginkgonis]
MEKLLLDIRQHDSLPGKLRRRIRQLLLLFALLSAAASAGAQSTEPITINGVVKDQDGQEVIGASIKVDGTANAVSSNANGLFKIVAPSNGILVISYLGYETVRIPVNGRQAIAVEMKATTSQLDEVVVVGYGTMEKKDLTGSITQIKATKLEKEAPRSVQDLLRGNAPGLNIGQTNGPKASASLEVRGQRSLKANNEPMVVLDGVVFFGELSEINPMDIETIDVLKDASSAAIFGARSANGVLMITTKKGKTEKPTIRFSANNSLATMGANREVYGPSEYLQYRQDLLNSGTRYATPAKYVLPTPENLAKYGITYAQWKAYDATPGAGTDEEIWLQRLGLFEREIENYKAGRTFDWYDYSFRNGYNQDYNISTSGRTPSSSINYYLSFGALKNEGVIDGDNYRAYRANFKLDAKVTNWLTSGININFQDRSDGNFATDWGGQIINNSPFSSPYLPDGTLDRRPMNSSLNQGVNTAYTNQFRKLDKGYTVLNPVVSQNVKLPLGITYTMNFSPRLQWFNDRYHESSANPDWTDNGRVNRTDAKNFDWQIDNILKWNKTFAEKHKIDVTLLQNAEEHRTWSSTITATDFTPTDALGYHNVGAANMAKSTISSNDTHSTGDALLARVFYGFDNRYMVTTSVRRDGYSAFGSSNPRATFASAAVAWNFTNEKFFHWTPMNYGKLSVSYGQNGNRSIGIYQALSNLTTGSGKYAYVQSNGTVYELSQLYVDRMSNLNLKWEATSAWNARLDFGFFDSRITGSVEAYHMPTTDLLMDQTLPDLTGFSVVTSNLGEVVNRGVELSLSTRNLDHKNFAWSSTFGLSANRNQIKHLYYNYQDVLDASGNVVGSREMDDISNGWFIGRDIGSIWTYKTIGIWQKGEEDQAKRYGQIPGDAKVQDVNDDGKLDNLDKQFLGYTTPRFRLNLRNDFTVLKNLDLSINMYSYLGHKSATTDYLNNLGANTERTNSYVRSYWTPENPSGTFARPNSTNPQNVSPPLMLSKSFVRLDNVSLSYTVPAHITKRLDISQLRISGAIRNVTEYSPDWYNWDPELTGPLPRTFSLGLNVTF